MREQSTRTQKLRVLFFLDNDQVRQISWSWQRVRVSLFLFCLLQILLLIGIYLFWWNYQTAEKLKSDLKNAKSQLVAAAMYLETLHPGTVASAQAPWQEQWKKVLEAQNPDLLEEIGNYNSSSHLENSSMNLQQAMRETNLELSQGIASSPHSNDALTPTAIPSSPSTSPTISLSNQTTQPNPSLSAASNLKNPASTVPPGDSQKGISSRFNVTLSPSAEEESEDDSSSFQFDMVPTPTDDPQSGTQTPSIHGKVCVVALLKSPGTNPEKFLAYPDHVELKADGKPKENCRHGEEVRFSKFRKVVATFSVPRAQIDTLLFYLGQKNSKTIYIKKFKI